MQNKRTEQTHIPFFAFVDVCKQCVMEQSQFLAQQTRCQMTSRVVPMKQSIQLFVQSVVKV